MAVKKTKDDTPAPELVCKCRSHPDIVDKVTQTIDKDGNPKTETRLRCRRCGTFV